VFLVEQAAAQNLEVALHRTGIGRFLRSQEIEIWGYEQRRNSAAQPQQRPHSWGLVKPGDVFIRSKGVYPPELAALEAQYRVSVQSLRFLRNQHRLEGLLESYGFTWERAVMLEIGKWHRSELSIAHMRNWLDQFSRLGRADVGRMLLNSLRIISPAELKELLEVSEITNESSAVAVLSDIDESGGTIAHLIRDDLGRDVRALSSVLGGNGAASIEVIEDGLWSGVQVAKAIDRLIRDRSIEVIRQATIRLRFGIRTDLGEYSVRSYLASLGLENISIAGSGEMFRILSPDAARAFTASQLTHEHVRLAQLASLNDHVRSDVNTTRTLSRRNRHIPCV
jgi:hypothetical protein